MQAPELKDPEREVYFFRRRLTVAGALIVLAFAGLFGRFVYLQVLQRQHYTGHHRLGSVEFLECGGRDDQQSGIGYQCCNWDHYNHSNFGFGQRFYWLDRFDSAPGFDRHYPKQSDNCAGHVCEVHGHGYFQ